MSITYRLLPRFDFDESKSIIREAAAALPNGAEILDQRGWDGLLEHFLGEGQFGPDRYNLSSSKRLYYRLKPFLPRSAVRLVRKGYRSFQENGFPLNWPIEERFVKFIKRVYTNIGNLKTENSIQDSGKRDSETVTRQIKKMHGYEKGHSNIVERKTDNVQYSVGKRNSKIVNRQASNAQGYPVPGSVSLDGSSDVFVDLVGLVRFMARVGE